MKFYYPDGTPIENKEDFLDFYSSCYYFFNNKSVEDRFERILKNGIRSQEEVFQILAWKFAKIDMKKSDKDQLCYNDIWSEEDFRFRLYEYRIEAEETEPLCKKILSYANKCETDEKAQAFLNDIRDITRDKEWGKYFYSVYMITLLYFVSQGKYPIVDSFAFVALKAIIEELPFGKRINYYGIAGRDKDAFSCIITKGAYAWYKEELKRVFGEEYKTRRVDQALWSYGKLFKK